MVGREISYSLRIIHLSSALEQIILALSFNGAKDIARSALGDVAEDMDWISDETRRRWLEASKGTVSRPRD